MDSKRIEKLSLKSAISKLVSSSAFMYRGAKHKPQKLEESTSLNNEVMTMSPMKKVVK